MPIFAMAVQPADHADETVLHNLSHYRGGDLMTIFGDVSSPVADLLAAIRVPVLRGLQGEIPNVANLTFASANPQIVWQGGEAVMIAQMHGTANDSLDVRMTWPDASGVTRALAIRSAGADIPIQPLLKRQWVLTRVHALLDAAHARADPGVIAELTTLATENRVATPYTSLLVLLPQPDQGGDRSAADTSLPGSPLFGAPALSSPASSGGSFVFVPPLVAEARKADALRRDVGNLLVVQDEVDRYVTVGSPEYATLDLSTAPSGYEGTYLRILDVGGEFVGVQRGLPDSPRLLGSGPGFVGMIFAVAGLASLSRRGSRSRRDEEVVGPHTQARSVAESTAAVERTEPPDYRTYSECQADAASRDEGVIRRVRFPAFRLVRWSAGFGAGLRGHRVGHRGHGPRHDHDARARLLLWRTRPAEEPRLDDRPVLRHLRGRQLGLGPVGVHARLGAAAERVHREPGRLRTEQRRDGSEPRILRHDPGTPVLRVPAEVRRDHARLDHRRLCGTDPVQSSPDLHRPLDDLRLCAHRALELGHRRLPQVARGHRLRGRSRRPHRRGGFRGRGRPCHRATPRHRTPRQPAEQHPVRDPRRFRTVVRMVRLQRRERPQSERTGRERTGRHESGRRRSRGQLDAHGLGEEEEALSGWDRRRGRVRPGGHHARLRIRRSDAFNHHRTGCRGPVQLRGELAGAHDARRLARRLRLPRCRRHLGDPRDRPVRFVPD